MKSIFDVTREIDAEHGTNVTDFGRAYVDRVRATEHVPSVGPAGCCGFCGTDCR